MVLKTEKQKIRLEKIIERLIKSPRLVWNPRYAMPSDREPNKK